MKVLLAIILFLILTSIKSYSYAEMENFLEIGNLETNFQESSLEDLATTLESFSTKEAEYLKEDIAFLIEENNGIFDPSLITNTLQYKYFYLTEGEIVNAYRSFSYPHLPIAFGPMRENRWLHGGEDGN